MKTPADLVRACFEAYETKNRAALERILAPDFTFTSPLDDGIDRTAYFERCWPNSRHLERFDIESLTLQGNRVIAEYLAHPIGGGEPFRNVEIFTVADGRIRHVAVYFGGTTAAAASEQEIRGVIHAWAEAIRTKDVEGVLRHFADRSVRFYLAPPLQATIPVRQNLEEWFATWQGDIGYEIRNLAVVPSGTVAYAHSLNHMHGTKTDGVAVDLWFRETIGLQRLDGRWQFTHEHESVPFAMDGSFRAAVDLKP